MDTTAQKALVMRFYTLVNAGQLDLLADLLHPAIVDHASHGDAQGREAVRQAALGARAAFPDLQFSVDDLIAEGDRVVARGRMNGTNTGPWLGQPATGRAIAIGWVSIFRLADGVIAERWVFGDDLAMMRQLGA